MPSADLARIADAVLHAARRAGAGAADVLVVDDAQVSVDVRKGALEEAQRAEGVEIGLRAILGRRQACISVSDISPAAIEAAAERAVAMARLAPEDPSVGLAEPDQLAADTGAAALDLFDPSDAPSPAALEELARRAEAAAAAVPGIAQTDGAGAAYGTRRVHLAATNGFSAGYRRTDHSLSVTAITGTGTGMERDWAADHRIHGADMDSPEEIGARAAARALQRADPGRPPTGAFPVLFDERVASTLIGHLAAAANGAAIARGSSWLRGRLGERILPEGIDLLEDPRRPRVPGSRPFDAEGLPTAAAPLVRDGVLARWVLDLSTARRLNLHSTANAARGPSAPPSPSASNLALTQGDRSRDDLLREMGTGLLVTSLIGATINPNTGDYSRGASGLWIENGEPVRAVTECTIAGNLLRMLASLVPANDARPWTARVVPSLLVEGLTIAGD